MKPNLNKNTSPDDFLNYYWLKKELVDFCKKHELPNTGGKKEIIDRVHHYLKTGQVLNIQKKNRPKTVYENLTLSLDSRISENYRNDEVHRAFFQSVIGDYFKFNVPFMNWMKKNTGKTYQDAVNKWKEIYKEKKTGKKYEISSQFQFNQYIRDFFRANPGLSRNDAIECWKYKKAQPGKNQYENSDLHVLNL